MHFNAVRDLALTEQIIETVEVNSHAGFGLAIVGDHTSETPIFVQFIPINALLMSINGLFMSIFSLFMSISGLFMSIFTLFMSIFSLFMSIFALFMAINGFLIGVSWDMCLVNLLCLWDLPENWKRVAF